MIQETKKCSLCKEVKFHGDFHKHPKLGFHPRCKPCRAAVGKKYYVDHPEKFLAYKLRARNETIEERTARVAERKAKAPLKRHVVARRSHLKINFGLTPENYDAILTAQKGVCAICGVDKPSAHRQHFYVDHCHTTGKIRGLLCGSCNTGLGHFKDNPDLLTTAISYLEKHL